VHVCVEFTASLGVTVGVNSVLREIENRREKRKPMRRSKEGDYESQNKKNYLSGIRAILT
jgi:hypothetical protein